MAHVASAETRRAEEKRSAGSANDPHHRGIIRIDKKSGSTSGHHLAHRNALTRRAFDRAASFYELAGHIVSTGQIAAVKAWQVGMMSPGDRVLYAGVGAGEDAVIAGRAGIDLTCIDLSNRMLHRTERKLVRAGVPATLIHGDVFEHEPEKPYDVVAANFFLNCFPRPMMIRMLGHLTGLVRRGGRLMIADIAPPQGCWGARIAHQLHNGATLLAAWTIGLAPLHPIYDYEQYFSTVGLRTERVQRFRLARIGPVAYQSTVAVRKEL